MRSYLFAIGMTTFFAGCSASSAKENANTNDVQPQEIKTETPQAESQAGAKTPEELGRKIIAAFKKNDVKAYLNCIHGEEKAKSEKEFPALKENLAADGLSDWSKVEFSRVRYHKGSQNLESFAIEFTYGKDYSGVIGGGNYALKKDDRYYIHHAFTGARMDRNF